METQRKTIPTVKVAYHEMNEKVEEGKPGNFTLKRTHSVWYSPQSGNTVTTEEGDANENQPSSGQQTAAKLVSNATWGGHSTRIVFSMKYSPANGLTPIRPQVVLLSEVELKPQQCAELF